MLFHYDMISIPLVYTQVRYTHKTRETVCFLCYVMDNKLIVLSLSGCDSGGVQFLPGVSDRSSVSGPSSGLSRTRS